MNSVATFEIYSQSIEDSLSNVYYSGTLVFNLKKYENGNVVFNGDVTMVDIERGRTDIPMSDVEQIREEFYIYIENHNDAIASRSLSIRFEIMDIDSRFACTYREYLNGRLVKEGKGWAKDFTNPREREAWDNAVIEYKRSNGIEMSTDMMKKGLNDVNGAISKLDTQFPLDLDLNPPLIETAIPTLATDPCNFANNIIKAAQVAISRINGAPSPVELSNYYIKLGKDNISSATTVVANTQQEATNSRFALVDENFGESYDYFMELDAEREEYLKTHSEEFYMFDVVDYEPPVLAELLNYGGGDEDYVDEDTGEVYTGKNISGGNKSEVLAALGFTGTDDESYCNSKMVTIKVKTLNGNKLLTVHRDLAAEIQTIFEEIYDIGFNVIEVGGYKYRTVRNPNNPNSTALSMHSFGCAIDINWRNNPFPKNFKKPFTTAPEYWNGRHYDPNSCIWTFDHPVVTIFRNHEWGWGGRYGDLMHFSKANGC